MDAKLKYPDGYNYYIHKYPKAYEEGRQGEWISCTIEYIEGTPSIVLHHIWLELRHGGDWKIHGLWHLE